MDNIIRYVKSREDFIIFVKELQEDFKNHPEKWENNRLDLFLEAIAAYAEDIQGYYNNTGQKTNADIPSWQVLADILSGATVYE
ncbi:DUF7660 family protein [Flavobacterium litorale]|uniref:DUF7660 domain-containing protein n=1 Tax=Flavobacterium litorale TaxID=2856519 RepID=A0ABX8VEJ5_9FLAO|nr:hypothetical protein [Flavobacterium litorale]QYJ69441.1 hypothetical protein K1I41_06005 [Flavobacterium litorale]